MSNSKFKNQDIKNMSALCKKVIDIQTKYEIKTLLDTVNQWDIKNKNQFKDICNFECLICSFTTISVCEWKRHIMSIPHMVDCELIENLFSYVCRSKMCKVLLFGNYDSLNRHMTKKHSEIFIPIGIPLLMSEVMKRKRSTIKQKPLFYCSHCTQFAETPIHENYNNIENLKHCLAYYCTFCNVSFISSPEMIDYHSLSVEHMTLKCFDMLCSTKTIGSQSEKNDNLPTGKMIPNANNDNGLAAVQNKLAINLIKLPMIMLNRYQKLNEYLGKCKLCNIIIKWESNCIFNHLLHCEYKFNLSGENNTTLKAFSCIVCDFSTNNFKTYKGHICSHDHHIKCYDTDLYSHFCNICDLYMYGRILDIVNHWNLNHTNISTIMNFSLLPKFMAKIFNDFNENPDRTEIIHYYGTYQSTEYSTMICSQQCTTCKVEFYTNADYKMHEVTSEHIILKFLSPIMSLETQKKLKTKCTVPTTIRTEIKDASLYQSNNYTIDHECENEKSNQINKSQNETNYTAIMGDGAQYSQPKKNNLIRSISATSESSFSSFGMSLDTYNQFNLYYSFHSEENWLSRISKINRFSEFEDNSTLASSFSSLNMCDYDVYKSVPVDNVMPNSGKRKDNERKSKDVSSNSVNLNFNNSESSLHKNRTSSEYSFNVEPNHEHATFLDKTLELYHSLERIMNPFENKEADEHYMDKIYGDYVYERLKYIKNPTVKHNLKLEIDKLFYNISKQ